jgi:hypothetical protein
MSGKKRRKNLNALIFIVKGLKGLDWVSKNLALTAALVINFDIRHFRVSPEIKY